MQNPIFRNRLPLHYFTTTGIGQSDDGEQVLNVENASGDDVTIPAGASFQVRLPAGLLKK
ncbi:hypothetical protein ACSNOH_09750 [Streptomyces sp. URMC 127]|uniref:hypothetical protein n=1 Tax=Streptomyces sp. URMC 127 TaxID=3423402 RepID=UPI003F1CFBDD